MSVRRSWSRCCLNSFSPLPPDPSKKKKKNYALVATLGVVYRLRCGVYVKSFVITKVTAVQLYAHLDKSVKVCGGSTRRTSRIIIVIQFRYPTARVDVRI